MVEFRRNTNLCLTANNAVSEITTVNVEFSDILEIEYSNCVEVHVEFSPKYLFALASSIKRMLKVANTEKWELKYFQRKLCVVFVYDK